MKVVKSLIFILFALCSLSGKAQEVAADSTGYIVRVGEMDTQEKAVGPRHPEKGTTGADEKTKEAERAEE